MTANAQTVIAEFSLVICGVVLFTARSGPKRMFRRKVPLSSRLTQLGIILIILGLAVVAIWYLVSGLN